MLYDELINFLIEINLLKNLLLSNKILTINNDNNTSNFFSR